jgi:hypothetical protein
MCCSNARRTCPDFTRVVRASPNISGGAACLYYGSLAPRIPWFSQDFAGVKIAAMIARQGSMKLAQILALAQERIRSGQLPSNLPSNIWAGHGDGHRCAVCDEVISSDERQYEFVGGQSAYRLHFSCHQAWIGCRSIA